jgi:hypothetical protein
MAEPLAGAVEPRAGDGDHGHAGVECADGLDDRLGVSVRALRDGGVQRPVRLHVVQHRAGGAHERGEGTDLVERVVVGLLHAQRDRAAAEAGQVRETGVGPDGDAGREGRGEARPDRPRVAGVEAARQVRARDRGEQGGVVAHRPGAERLPGVDVQVDGGAHAAPISSIAML